MAMVLIMVMPGDPIDCIVEEIPNSVMDTYCWIHSTFRQLQLRNKSDLISMFSVPEAPGADKTEFAPFGLSPESQMEDGQDLRWHLVVGSIVSVLNWERFATFFSLFASGSTSITSGSVLHSSSKPFSSIFQGLTQNHQEIKHCWLFLLISTYVW